MKKLLFIPLLLSLMFVLSSCDKTTDPTTPEEQGTLSISSSPSGVQVYEGSTLKTTTPDTALKLSAGSHTLTFKLSGYRDTSVTYTIIANTKIQKFVQLTSDLIILEYGFGTPIQIWETDDPSSSHPSGFVLATGQAFALSGVDKDKVDIVYSTAANYNLITASQWASLPRITYFKAGTGSNITDTETAPDFSTSTWNTKIPDSQTNYFFVYDNDHHFSKVQITSRHLASGPGDYGWVKLKWVYNKTVDDKRFY